MIEELAFSGLFGGFCGVIAGYWAAKTWLPIRETNLERRVDSLEDRFERQILADRAPYASAKAQEAAARMEEAMAEAAGIFQSELSEDEKKSAMLKLAAKYPDVAYKLGKKFLK